MRHNHIVSLVFQCFMLHNHSKPNGVQPLLHINVNVYPQRHGITMWYTQDNIAQPANKYNYLMLVMVHCLGAYNDSFALKSLVMPYYCCSAS